jgi:hypothetical protein
MPGFIDSAGGTIYRKFTSRTTTGAPTVLAGTPAVSVYKNNSTTQSTTGVTLSVDFDGVVGLNLVTVDTSADGTFYANGSHFDLIITTGTVGGTSVVGEVVGSFDLAATVPADIQTIKTQAVTAAAGVTFPTSIASPTNITAGTITTVGTTTTLTNLPAITAGWLTAAGIAASALNGKGDWNIGKTGYALTQTFPTNFSSMSITAGGIVKADLDTIKTQTVTCAGGVTIPAATLASTTNITAATGVVLSGVTHTGAIIPTVTTLTNLPAITTDWLTGTGVAASAVTKIQAGLATPTNITAATGVTLAAVTHTGATIPAVSTTTTTMYLTYNPSKYMNGVVWIGPIANTNTASYTDGIMSNPVSTIAAAKTIADALKIYRFWIQPGTTITLLAAYNGYVFTGANWTLETSGSQSVGSSTIDSAINVTGTYAGAAYWTNCGFGATVTLSASNFDRCEFGGTQTLGVGSYDFVDCASSAVGTAVPIFDCATPGSAQSLSFRRWSGGITFSNINANTTITIDMVSGGVVTLGGADGNVQIRGAVASVVDNRTGSPTLGQTAALNNAGVSSAVLDAFATASDSVQASPAPSTTQFAGSSSLNSGDSWYVGSVLVFTSGALDGLARKITSYTGSTRLVTVTTAWPAAPTAGDTFRILGRID